MVNNQLEARLILPRAGQGLTFVIFDRRVRRHFILQDGGKPLLGWSKSTEPFASNKSGLTSSNIVDRLKTDEGKTFNQSVLSSSASGDVRTLSPQTQVTAKVVGHVLGDKIRIGKRRPKSGYRKQTGFRAHLS